MKTLFLIAAHGGSDSGAVSNVNGRTYREADLSIEFRDLLIEDCKKVGLSPKTDFNTNALSATLNWLRTLVYDKDSILIDIHWNSSSDINANGTENFIPDDYTKKELELATEINKIFVKYGLKNRGVKTESQSNRRRLGIFRTNCEQILIEVGFISNSRDMTIYEQNKQEMSKDIISLLKKEFVLEKTHIVKKGENLWSIARIYNKSPQEIANKNNINTNSIIRIGQILKI